MNKMIEYYIESPIRCPGIYVLCAKSDNKPGWIKYGPFEADTATLKQLIEHQKGYSKLIKHCQPLVNDFNNTLKENSTPYKVFNFFKSVFGHWIL